MCGHISAEKWGNNAIIFSCNALIIYDFFRNDQTRSAASTSAAGKRAAARPMPDQVQSETVDTFRRINFQQSKPAIMFKISQVPDIERQKTGLCLKFY
jgi:hypothetical protein